MLVLWGALLVVVSSVGIPKGRAAQRLMDGARPLVAPDYLERERALVAQGRAGLQQFAQIALPRLAAKLGITPAELSARYPDIANGIDAIPGIADTTDMSLANLQDHQSDFHDADTFPMADVSRLGESVGGIVFGVVLVALGILSWIRERRWPVASGLALTMIGAVLPLAFWLPGKARGVEDMAASLNLTKETADTTRANFETIDRFRLQLQHQLVPDAAAAAGITPTAVRAEVQQGLDALQATERDYPAIVRLFTPDVRLRETAYPDFQDVKGVPVVALTWTFIAGNAAVAATAGAALWSVRRQRR